MSQHSEDNFTAGSESFWEPGNYKNTTKRIEDGHRLCSDLMTMVSDRADIEKKYARDLKQWAIKWNNLIEKGPEYGTMEAAWKGALVEADRRSEVHNRVKEDLNLKVNSQIKQWQKDHYHKSMMTIKEKKDMDDQFKKAQKSWAKLLSKVNKAKADYHNACKAERTAINLERNASGDSSFSADNLKKLQDRVQKCKDTVGKTRDHYEACLADLNNLNGRYMEDMTDVFEKCQQMEAQRLQTFKDILFTLQKCLNVSEDPILPQIYEEFHHTVNNADHEKDLRWWSNTYGVNMAMNWPQFEEYAEEFRDIGGKGSKKTGQIADGNITLINQRHVGDDLPPPDFLKKFQSSSSSGFGSDQTIELTVDYNSAVKANGSSKSSRNGHSKTAPSATSAGLSKTTNNDHSSYKQEMSNGGAGTKDSNPFDEEEWEDDHLVDHGEPGVKVKALYDFEPGEDDELGFKIGDIFEKLEDEDEQGWCKGRKDGRVGLYPANYVEVIE